MPHPVVIVGTGLAGWSVAREFRKLDTSTPVLLITSDSGDFYAKPSLSNAFAQQRTPQQLVSTAAHTMAQSLNASLLAHTRVEAIDRATQSLQTSQSGARHTLHYSRLVLATGAQAIHVPVQGDAASRVRSINSLDDFSAFYSELTNNSSAGKAEANSKTILIMGAGLIGCEFANDLMLAGYRVHVVDPSARPLATLLPEAASAQLQDALSVLGVVWHFGATVQAVQGKASGSEPQTALTVQLSNGQVVQAHAVLSAIGLRADTTLAKAAGLLCERGIVVDACLQTSAPHVYALGDCAQYAVAGQRTLPFILPIMNAAKVLAANLAGTVTPLVFPLMPVSIKTPSLPVVVASAHPSQAGSWVADPVEAGGLWRFMDAEGLQRGFVLTGKQSSRRAELSKLPRFETPPWACRFGPAIRIKIREVVPGAGIEPAHKVRFVNTALGRAGSGTKQPWKTEEVVPGAGIEPARLAAGDFESPASTNFTTRAMGREG
jgi:rubredoxin-NAD+ reductase